MSTYQTSKELTIAQRYGDDYQRALLMKDRINNELRVMIPAKVIEVNYNEMTVSCQPLIKEHIKNEASSFMSVDLPLLTDVPIVMPGSSTYSITLPLSVGDEGIVIFADMCIDSWWQSGGIQDQFEIRRHDLSDGFFIPAQMSQAKKYTNVNQTSLEVKNRQSGVGITISNNDIGLKFKNDSGALISTSIKTLYNKLYDHKHDFSYSWTETAGSATGTTDSTK